MTIERTKLFDLVWEFPLSKLAPRFGISDRGLSEVCERYNVPLPPRGKFWKELPQDVRLASRIRPSAATPFDSVIMPMIEEGKTIAAIRAVIAPMGFAGSHSSLADYIQRRMRGKTRFVLSSNQHRTFLVPVRSSPRPYEVERPPLPEGPLWCCIGERHQENEQRPVVAVPANTLLDAITPELEYAKLRDRELAVCFWLAVGCDPSVKLGSLTWESLHRLKLTELVHTRLQELSRPSGPVLTNPGKVRTRLSWILGPNWKRHAATIRSELLRM